MHVFHVVNVCKICYMFLRELIFFYNLLVSVTPCQKKCVALKNVQHYHKKI